jgi:hypothetical protein
MTCHHVQLQLSLYLYGELDFASEEALENHLSGCALCQQCLVREKKWHTTASSEYRDVPLDLLSRCRQDLRNRIALESSPRKRTWSWPAALRISPTPWSYRFAVASFLVFLGFAGARFLDHYQFSDGLGLSQAKLFNPSTRISDIQPDGEGRVRIVLDQINQREVVGNPQDQNVKQWLLIATQDTSDPGIRVDSVEMLGQQGGVDVRDALLDRIQHDPNAAVRLKALESVRRFSDDPETRNVLRSALEHDVDPAVRSEAIDILAPINQRPQLSPELAATLQNLARSENDDYVRERCLQLLRAIHGPLDIY